MSETSEAVSDHTLIEHSAFLCELVRMMRAQDSYGRWEKKSDAEVLAPYILDKAARRLIPIIGDPAPDVLWRLELFYNAVGLSIERATGLMAGPMIKINHEGFGRAILIVGQLIVFSRHHRDVHRFGFENMQALSEAGEQIILEASALIDQFSAAAKAD